MKFTADFVAALRSQFPALARQILGQSAVFLDGPAGTQVPQPVIDAISNYLSRHNANHGGLFPTALESDALLDAAHVALAEFVGGCDPGEIALGQNMTSLTFALSRALGRTWRPGDEIVVTRLDHDANFSPWVLAARDAGATVRIVEIHRADCTLDLDDFQAKINPRTKLVAVGCASNSSGGVNPVRKIADWAHAAGALVFVDAVHYAPHALLDVTALDCDFLACSAYKFFGPHLGVLWGRRKLLEQLEAYKLRPAPDTLPGKWMTGTQSHESIAGALAAVDYLADIGRTLSAKPDVPRRPALAAAFSAIGDYERGLLGRLLTGLAELREIKDWGITAPERWRERVATGTFTHARHSSASLAQTLGQQGIFAWHGNYYALNLSETLGNEPQGMLRVGLVHYNTAAEVDRLLSALQAL